MNPINLNPERRNFGETTGGTRDSDTNEALEIVKLIAPVVEHLPRDQTILSNKDVVFAHAQVLESLFPMYRVTGKQLFWLRDIKDKLVEAGKL